MSSSSVSVPGVSNSERPHAFSAAEAHQFAEGGFVVRTAVFTRDEVHAITDACEQLVRDVLDSRRRRRIAAGAYVFEPNLERGLSIKWEGESDVVHGIEPCAHVSPALHRLAHDARFLAPMATVCSHPEPMLFTEKLNLKRPYYGGINPLHQDYPYWTDVTDVASQVGTAMLFLDDASRANGCLEVVPGSHRMGQWRTRSDADDFGNNELDVSAYPGLELRAVEVPAGSVVYFGAFLVHKSEPNRSADERRALLFSYQPPGHRTLLESLLEAAERNRLARAARAAADPPPAST